MPTQLALANEALAQAGQRSQFTSLVGPEPEKVYINSLYGPIRDFLLAEGDYDFSLVGAILPAGTSTIAPPWALQYPYPVDALRIRQLVPTSFDALEPRPVEWNITVVSGARKIYTHVAMSSVFYTKAVDETLWEPLFSESFVRMLSSALGYALTNKLEASKLKMDEALSFAGVAGLRDE